MAAAFIAFMVWHSFSLAWRTTLDDLPAYEVLHNASVLSSGPSPLMGSHAFLPTALLSVLIFAAKVVAGQGYQDLGYRAAHLLAAVYQAGFLYALYRLLRLRWDKKVSVWTTVAASMNPLLIALGPSIGERMPALTFLTACFYFHARYEQKGRTRHAAWFIVCAAAAASSDYRLAVLLPAMLFLYDVVGRAVATFSGAAEDRPEASQRGHRLGGLLGAVAPAAAFLAMGVLYQCVFTGRTILEGLPAFKDSVFNSLIWSIGGGANYALSYELLPRIFTWPGLAMAAWGAAVLARSDRRRAFWWGGWAVLFFLVQTYFFMPGQSDLLLPLLPALYFLVAAAASRVGSLVARPRYGKAAAAVLALAAAAVISQAILSLRKFEDPLYSSGVMRKVIRGIGAGTAPAVAWLGKGYWFYPVEPALHPGDAFSAACLMHWPSIAYYSKDAPEVTGFYFIPTQRAGDPHFSFPPIAAVQRDGAGFAVYTGEVPDRRALTPKYRPAPLWFGRVRVIEFALSGSGTWACTQVPSATMQVEPRGDGVATVRLRGLPAGEYQVFTESWPVIDRVTAMRLPVTDGNLQFEARLPAPGQSGWLRLVAFAELSQALPNGEVRRLI